MKTQEISQYGLLTPRRRRGAALVGMLPNLVLMLLIGGGVILAVYKDIPGTIVDTVISSVMEPFLLLIEQIFGIVAPLSPILVALIPLYLAYGDDGPASIEALSWSAAYGVALFFLVIYAGIDTKIMTLIQSSWTGSLIGGVLGAASGIGNLLIGVLMALTYWGVGMVLELLVVFFKVLTGVGNIAEYGVRVARKVQNRVLERLEGGRDK